MHVELLVKNEEIAEAFNWFKVLYRTLEKNSYDLPIWILELWCLIKDSAAVSPKFSEIYNLEWKEITMISYLNNDN